MITDEERREIARKMQSAANCGAKDIACILNDVLRGEEKQPCVNEDCRTCSYVTLQHLADLIEPPRQCPHYHIDRHYCSVHGDVVDRDALLALANDLDYAGANLENVAYVDKTFHESANRIREALGVE